MTSPKIKISLAAMVLVGASPCLFISALLLGLLNAAQATSHTHGPVWFVLWMVSPYAAILPMWLLHRLDDEGVVEVID